ncbi:hypothetical protein HAX54_039315 [Datura stramonium]|uniref:KIB1-4 beta-propeller domain-containing protein n=1 Tax=Datura stramonium TaxID=4076 RepID=A0ABS8VQA1_DATST|nr:hypothetical protein [Datura stramonium]
MRSAEWLDIPPELWSDIAERVAENEMDHLRFRSICSLWRSSALPLRKSPLPSLPALPDPSHPKKRKKPTFVEKTVYLLQIPEDLWNLPLMKGFKRSFLIKVSKPFSGHKLRIENLLSRTSSPENKAKSSQFCGSVLNLWNLRVTELCKGHFCAVDIEGRTLLFDSSSFAATEISPPMVDNPNNFISGKRLVESCGELFLVELYTENTKVYRLSMEEKAWIQVESLGNRIFFIAEDCSFSLSAQEFPGNCVYFKDGEGKEYDEHLRFCGPKTSVYDLETGRLGGITSFPEHLEIFWPPPKWLEHSSLLTLVLLKTIIFEAPE